jgi:chromosome segregation ATPase
MELIKKELASAKEKLAEFEGATATKKQLTDAQAETETLKERLETQVELIRSLEDEIKTAKVFKRDSEEKDGEVEQLHEELETKNTIITRLQSDLDDQQRKLAKLRGSDSETTRLKALSMKDQSKIDVLERENAELRAMIESVERDRTSGTDSTGEREIALQAKIAELTESARKWKSKYEFLATEAPDAYQTQNAAK